MLLSEEENIPLRSLLNRTEYVAAMSKPCTPLRCDAAIAPAIALAAVQTP
jgi:hypothetical protein